MTKKARRLTSFEITVDAEVEAVWRAVTDAQEIAHWFGWHYDGQDDEIKEIFLASSRVLEPGRAVRINEGEEFHLEPVGHRTRIRVVHASIPDDADWDETYDPTFSGWRSFLAALRHYLAYHAGKDRQSFYRAALAAGSPEAAFDRMLGWIDPSRELARLSPGDHLVLPIQGESLSTTVLDRSALGVSLQVDSLDRALWVAGAGLWATEQDGPLTFVNTTFSAWLDATEFEPTKANLRAWWKSTQAP